MSDKIYVDEADPVGNVEAFITKYQIDANFRPLARLLRRFTKRVVNLATIVPAAFAAGGWSVAKATTSSATVTVTTLPAEQGGTITKLQYAVNAGTWTDLPGLPMVGAHTITGLPVSTTPSITLRAVNAYGLGIVGTAKTVALA